MKVTWSRRLKINRFTHSNSLCTGPKGRGGKRVGDPGGAMGLSEQSAGASPINEDEMYSPLPNLVTWVRTLWLS